MKIIDRFKNLEGERKAQIIGGAICWGMSLLEIILCKELDPKYFGVGLKYVLGIDPNDDYDENEDEPIYSSFSEEPE